jgi:hypothetical protein
VVEPVFLAEGHQPDATWLAARMRHLDLDVDWLRRLGRGRISSHEGRAHPVAPVIPMIVA